ncbi:MAG: tyrocidine synthetase-3, partial [Crocinitomicaceae bacterium]
MISLIKRLKERNIAVWVSDDKIKMSYGSQAPEQEIIESIKTNKADLLAFLKKQRVLSESAFDSFVVNDPNDQLNGQEGNLINAVQESAIEAVFPATSLQQGLVFHYLSSPDDDAYRVQLMVDYCCKMDIEKFQEAWILASAQYPILRTAFDWEEEILQIITKNPGISSANFSFVDISSLSEELKLEKINEIQEQDRKIPFDLSKPGLLRFTIIKQNDELFTVLRTEHHSISDGWSSAFLMHTVHQNYNQLVRNETPVVEVESAYLEAQKYYQKSNKSITAFWSKEKASFGSANDVNMLFNNRINLDKTKSIEQPGENQVVFSGEQYDKLKNNCRELGVTVNAVMQFAWHKLMQTYTGDEQTIVGTTVSGRDIPIDGIETSVGLYANTLPLVVNWNKGDKIKDVLHAIQESVALMNSHGSVSLASLQNKGDSLFHSICSYLNYPDAPVSENQGDTIESTIQFRQAVEKVDYPVMLRGHDSGTQLLLELKYGEAWIEEARAIELLEQIQLILEAVATDPEQAIDSIGLLHKEKQERLLIDWNKTASDYPTDKTLQDLFEGQAEKTPDTVAVVSGNTSLTYSELNAKANQLAFTIRENYQNQYNEPLAAGTFVALYLDRGVDVIVSILAVLKAGGSYVPLSPEYPIERTKFILEDTQSKMLLLQHENMASIFMDGWLSELTSMPGLLLVDEDYSKVSSANLEPFNESNDLAYVIYTSGTTGKPKGVLVDHKAVVSFVYENKYMPEKAEKVASLAPYSFDGFVFDTFYSLLNGSSVHLLDKSLSIDIESLVNYFTTKKIDSLFTTTALFNELVKSETLQNSEVRNILFGGEKADLAVIQKGLKELEAINLVHVYGPTETVVFASAYHFNGTTTTNAPIGSPLNNKQFYVLDAGGNVVPVGCPGELYIGGAGLAKGYLNQQALTDEKFVNNPFATEEDKSKGYTRLYRTGDLVRWLADGNIEFIGRIDKQVKIRGHRIEPGEIETVLNEFPEVENAVVVDLEKEGAKYLAAYVVSAKGEDYSVEDLRRKLALKLPDYMVPNTFSELEKIPLTINGKLDKKALPDPEFASTELYVAPRNEVEEKLCAIWQEILGQEKVGIQDNFFLIGGDSIVGIRVISKAKSVGLYLAVQDLFSNPTIAELAPNVQNIEDAEVQDDYKAFSLLTDEQQLSLEGLYPENLGDAFPATHLQMGMLLESTRDIGVYHDVLSYQINDKFDEARFKGLLQQLVDRHEVLRTGFAKDEQEGYLAVIAKESTPHFEVIRSAITKDQIIENEHAKSFDFGLPGLYRFIVSQITEDSFLFTFSLHHGIIDGWSVASLISELIQNYILKTPELDNSFTIPSYGAFVRNEKNAIEDPKFAQFWSEYLKDYESPKIPFVSTVISNNAEQEEDSYLLKEEEAQVILNLSKEKGIPVDSIFLAIYYHVLCLFQDTEDLAIGLVTNNRLEQTGGDKLLGLFLNTVPFRPDVDKKSMSVGHWIERIAEEKTRLLKYKALPYAYIKSNYLSDANNYQSVFNYVHFHVVDDVIEMSNDEGERAVEGGGGYEKINIPMAFSVSRQGDHFFTGFKSHKGSIDPYAFKQFWKYFKDSIGQLASNADNLEELPLIQLSDKDRNKLRNWNQTDTAFQEQKTLHSLFEGSVLKSPENTALIEDNKTVTYIELNERANKLARYIRSTYKSTYSKDLPSETLIALCFERGIEMVVGILAVLKSGGAYLPISPDYPEKRFNYIIEDSKAELIISHNACKDKVISQLIDIENCNLLIVEDAYELNNEVENLDLSIDAQKLAYVIYTSGTTGNPKGVMVEHRSVVNLTEFICETHELQSDTKALFFSDYVFDASVYEIFPSLTAGAEVFIASKEQRENPTELIELINENKITKAFIPTVLVNLMAKELADSSLKIIHTGGDELKKLSHLPAGKLFNQYGPTEATVMVSQNLLKDKEDLSIGKAIANAKLYVLDRAGVRVPLGSPGELHVGGVVLARGYWNRPELTAEKFIENPFASEEDLQKGYNRLFKTGDMVRFQPDGSLQFLGRLDNQVKIQGHRIELGEVEAALKSIASVDEAVVVDREKNGTKQLAAYIISTSENEIDLEGLRYELSQELPRHMVPSSFTEIDKIPLTINGKLDRKALPDPEFVSGESFVAPTNELEEKLCEIWKEVLGLDRVGIKDNFFSIGGDSITAIRLTSVSRRELEKDIPLSVLFEHGTIQDLAKFIDSQSTELITIEKLDTLEYPLSFAQERLLFIERFEKGSTAYHIPFLVKLKKDTDLTHLQKAFNVVIDRHPVLKSIYLKDEAGNDYQRAIDIEIPINQHFFKDQNELLPAVQKVIETPFELEYEVSIKLNCYEAEGERHLLILWHHIAFDGWSTNVFIQELTVAYNAIVLREEVDLPKLEISYGDFAAWQHDYLGGEELEKLLGFWGQQLSGYETLQLPTDFTRPNVIDYTGKDYAFELNQDVSEKLRELAKENKTTLYTVLLSGFYVALSNLSGQSDILIGTPSDNRSHSQTQALIGFFVNSLALRVDMDSSKSVTDLIQNVHQVVSQAKIHQELPFEKLVKQLNISRDASRHPLFQVIFSLVEAQASSSEDSIELPFEMAQLTEGESLYSPAKFDLGLSFNNTEDNIVGGFNYAVSLFTEESIERFVAVYKRVMAAFVESTSQRVNQISTVSEKELSIQLDAWSGVEEAYPFDKTLHGLFEEQVVLSPDNIAVTSETETLTYGELNAKANQLARVIRDTYQSNNNDEAMPADTFVGLYLERGVEMVVSILAVLKAGGTYVPISPEYPIERVKFILDDTKAPIVLLPQAEMTSVIMEDWLSDLKQVPALLVADDEEILADKSTENLENINEAKDLAYVIYTSGTTGQPKGVLTPHQAVVSLVQDNHFISLSENDVFLHLSNPNFDAATLEIWGALTHGSKLVTPKENISLSAEKLEETLKAHGVSVLWLTKTLFDSLYTQTPTLFGGLKYLLVGGEALTPDLIKGLVSQAERPTHILNGYGPTESTTFATTHDCADFGNTVPLGKPINTRKVYVLDASGNIAPIGSPGELHIAGAGLARGYLNRPELTAEKFINNSFATVDDKAKGYDKLYKTGDLVRWLADGTLEYLSRMDSQIKLRGYRIELGEIETAINELTSVKQVVVVDLEKEGSKYLAAYIVSAEGEDFSADEFRSKLAVKLPDYMVPSTFTALEFIPLTINGKLDRKALPSPDFVSEEEYVAPTNQLEEKLCTIWEEVLEVDKVGIHDNFFHIGGDSIVAIRVISKAKTESLYFSVQDLFSNPTVATLKDVVSFEDTTVLYERMSLLDAAQTKLIESIPSYQIIDAYPATYLQMGMLLESSLEAGTYHDIINYTINTEFNEVKLSQALIQLVSRHEVLRTGFIQEEKEGYFAFVVSEMKPHFSINETAISGEELLKLEQGKAFDFEVPGLFRFIVSNVQENSFRLTVSFHHAAIDGWSEASLIAELIAIYTAETEVEQSTIVLPDYGEYVRNEKEVFKNVQYEEFWSNYLKGFESPAIPFINEAKSNKAAIKEPSYLLSEEESKTILAISKKLGQTVDCVFISIYHHVLSLFQGSKDVMFGIVVNNRLEKEGGDQMCGLFLNTIPFRPTGLEDGMNTLEVLDRIGKEKQRVLEFKSLPYGYMRSKWLSDSNGFQCAFNYVHFRNREALAENTDENVKPILGEREGVGRINIPIMLSVSRVQDNFFVSLEVNEGSISENAANQFWAYYKNVIKTICESESLDTTALPTLTEEDSKKLEVWNETKDAKPLDKTLHGLFEEQVLATPNNIALTFADEKLTYSELNARANQLARVIRTDYNDKHKKDLEPDTLVALYLDRSIEMVVGILAVLKAGGAYVPISPSSPAERTSYMLEDAKCAIVLTQEKYVSDLDKCTAEIENKPTIIPCEKQEITIDESTENLSELSTSKDLAYVIYTSGTTGKPKGVEIEHQASVTRNWYMSQRSQTKDNTYLYKTNYIFDVSVSDLFSHLFVGAHLVVTASSFDVDEIEAAIEKENINACHFVPSQFPAITISGDFYKQLDRIYFSGESLTKEHLSQIDLERTEVINYYGPTETGEATSHIVKSHDAENVIGEPFDGTQVYVLTKDLQECPVGSPGELFVAGAGVARGYLNLPDLTAERFITNPFASEKEKANGFTRFYKTGDLARWLPNGELEYLGRIDNQIKLRGYRIELGEIESALNEIPEVSRAVVVDIEKEGNTFLAAYFVPVNETTIPTESIREMLSKKLPDYMVPSTFTELEFIPLTNNGKLDRRALPDSSFSTADNYVAPTNELERQLCAVWEEVLGVEKVGIQDNFFYVGGDSIAAVRLSAVCRRELKMELPLPLLFEHKSISGIAKHMNGKELLQIPKTTLTEVPLSFAQERLLFIERFEQGTNAYHMPFFTQLNDNVNLEFLDTALKSVLDRHSVLKTVFKTNDKGDDYQVVLSDDVTLHENVSESEEQLLEAMEMEISRPFDLTSEPSIRLHRYQLEEKQFMLILWHHIAFDGWSTNIFLNEMATTYSALLNGETPSLPELEITYADYSAWQRETLKGESLTALLKHWNTVLNGYETLNLPTDFTRPKHIDYTGKDFMFEIDNDLSTKLRELAKQQKTTLYTVMLSAFYATLSTMSGQSDILIGTPSDNRSHTQIQPLIGFFVNSLALRANVQGKGKICELIDQVHNVITQAKINEELPFEKLVGMLGVEHDAARHPLFQIIFSLLEGGEMGEANPDSPFVPVQMESANSDYSTARYDISFMLTDYKSRISGVINYASSLFVESSMERLLQVYMSVLEAFGADNQTEVGEIDTISVNEKEVLLTDWSGVEEAYPFDKTLHGLFEEQVALSPDTIAVTSETETLTYAELNAKANQLARVIRDTYQSNNNEAMPADTFVGLYLERGVEMVISILAVLKAGGTYVPISPEYPIDRVKFILNDTKAPIMLLPQDEMAN